MGRSRLWCKSEQEVDIGCWGYWFVGIARGTVPGSWFLGSLFPGGSFPLGIQSRPPEPFWEVVRIYVRGYVSE